MLKEPAENTRESLRFGEDEALRRRRGIVCLSLFSGAVLGIVSLFQVGVIRRLPDPPIKNFDADAVNGSDEAYSICMIPDALLGLASYSITALLAGMGSQQERRANRLIPIAMGTKALADAVFAGKLGLEQLTKFRKFSAWSLLVSGATFTSLALAAPEVKRALLCDSHAEEY